VVGWGSLIMARDYRPVDRDQPFLLPPDMREWVAGDHLVWFVISVVGELDLSAFGARSRRGGVGRAGFDPRMLLVVLVYAYAVGQRSSRQIERLCQVDVAFMIACARDVPDHTTIARFRKDHAAALEGLFAQVLVLCARAGLGRFGTVAIDGTKIAANASDGAMRSHDWLREQAAAIFAEADRVDAEEDALFGDARGDELPPELVDPVTRRQRIRKALADLDAEQAAADAARAKSERETRAKAAEFERILTDPSVTAAERRGLGHVPDSVDPVLIAQARLDRQIAEAQAKIDNYERRKALAQAQGRRPKGQRPVDVEDRARVVKARQKLALAQQQAREQADRSNRDQPAATGKRRYRNITDPDARSMPTRRGWIVGYNVQLAVSADQIIIAADATQDPTDPRAFIPMLRAVERASHTLTGAGYEQAAIGTVLADAGYRSAENAASPGPDRLIATGRRRDDERRAREQPAQGPPPADAGPLEAMDHRLRTEDGRRLYRQRSPIVEGVNGQLKDVTGLRRFARRGLTAVNSELQFTATVHNLLKLFRAQALTTCGFPLVAWRHRF